MDGEIIQLLEAMLGLKSSEMLLMILKSKKKGCTIFTMLNYSIFITKF